METAADILEELPAGCLRPAAALDALPVDSAPGHLLSPAQRLVLELMGFDPISSDGLQARGAWPMAELSAHLLELELPAVWLACRANCFNAAPAF